MFEMGLWYGCTFALISLFAETVLGASFPLRPLYGNPSSTVLFWKLLWLPCCSAYGLLLSKFLPDLAWEII